MTPADDNIGLQLQPDSLTPNEYRSRDGLLHDNIARHRKNEDGATAMFRYDVPRAKPCAVVPPKGYDATKHQPQVV